MRNSARLLPLMALGILIAACSSDPAARTAPPASTAPPAASPSAPSAAAPRAAPPAQNRASVALAAARSKSREEQREVIKNLILDGVFSQIELNDGVPRVYLKPAFRLLTPEDKHLYLATVYAFAYPDGGSAKDEVVLFDAVNGEQTGTFTQEGFQ